MKMSPGWMTSFRLLAWGSLRGETFTLLFFPNKINVNGGKVVEVVGGVSGHDGGVVVVVGGAGSIRF